ncbi:MAG: tetratricopeptide repeat protein [Spirochaetia bacterium]|nr:tetratricopeptide repeat protein [Spirochaetia bacterium]
MIVRLLLCCLLLLPTAVRLEETPQIPPQPDLLLRDAFEAEILDNKNEALKLYNRYLETGEESAFVRGQQARLFAGLKQGTSALSHAKRALEISPDRKEYHILYAELLRQSNEKEEAYSVLSEAANRFQDDGEIEFFLAEVCSETGRNAEAVVNYRQLLFHSATAGSRFPLFRSVALLRLAMQKLRVGERAVAGRFLVQYLRYNPDRLFPRYLLGYEVYTELGNYEAAVRELEIIALADPAQAIEAGVDMRRTYGALGLMLYVMGDQGCEKYLNYLSERDPRSLFSGVLAAQRGDDTRALSILLPLLKQNALQYFARVAIFRVISKTSKPDDLIKERLALANLSFQSRRYRSGIELLFLAEQSVLNKEVTYSLATIQYQIALGYIQMEQPFRSIAYLRESIASAEASGEGATAAKVLLARQLATKPQNRDQEALDLLNPLIQSGDNIALSERALLYQTNNDCKQALPDWNNVIEKDSDNASALFFRAACFETELNYPAAEADVKQVLKLRPSFAEASNFLSYMSALQNKELEEARTLSMKAIEVQPDNPAYQDTLGWVFYQSGKPGLARYHIQFAARLMEEGEERHAEIYDHLGDVYLKLADKPRALYNYDLGLRAISQKSQLSDAEIRLKNSLQQKIQGKATK